MEKHELFEKVETLADSIIYVVGKNYYLTLYGIDIDLTWKELLDKAIINRKAKYGSCLIIVENPLSGQVYQFGNYDRNYVYTHGKSEGYA